MRILRLFLEYLRKGTKVLPGIPGRGYSGYTSFTLIRILRLFLEYLSNDTKVICGIPT